MDQTVIPPALLDKIGFEEVAEFVARMGLAWYMPILYGGICLLLAIAANWLIGREVLPRLVYFACLALVLPFSIHWAMLGRLRELEFGPPGISIYIEAILWLAACVVLHLRVNSFLSRWFDP